jgi:S-DNA-T family DNA segregation ATPase FtsK/SpoIIIE
VRFSLGHVGDVEVSPGAALADCAGALAALLGPLAGAPLSVDGVPLGPDHVAGVAPWQAGCHVHVAGAGGDPGRAARRAAEAAVGAPWHLAVVAGPDAGAVGVPDAEGRLRVGRAPGAAAAGTGARASGEDGVLALTDPAVSRRHLVVRGPGRGGAGRGTSGGGAGRRRLRVRDVGSANGTAVRRRGRWRRVRLRRVRRARAGDGTRLRVGGTVLEVRAAPRAAPEGAAPDDDAARPAPAAPVPRGVAPAATLVPLVLAAVLAASTRSPLFLLMAAAGPLTALAQAGAERRRARRAARAGAGGGAEGADLGPDAAAATVLLGRGHRDLPPWWALAAEGLAVVGDAGTRRAVGRALAGAAVLHPDLALDLRLDPAATDHWRWARWLGDRLAGPDGPPPGGPHLVVADGLARHRTALERWWLRATGGDRAVVVLDDAAPPWCRWVLRVAAPGPAAPAPAGVLTGPGGPRAVAVPLGSPAWAEAHARRVAARDAGRASRRAALPTRVSPADVGLPTDVDGVVAAWRAGAGGQDRGLRTPVGVAAGAAGPGRAWLDLVADGPHALVAGTTGAGKSELLQALVLGLALRHPPGELALVLLDFKGGAGLGPCWELPHVVGRVTDLDREQAVRALEALAAELRRREAVLAAAGVGDVAALRGPGAPAGVAPLPRLLVVVDEFRALAEDLPDFVPALVRLAAQGRSLGMHLVLATQRPGGAVTAQMRANLALRICLRVTDAADSVDVVDVPDAARLPPDAPGRAVVRRGSGAPTLVQAVWPALPAGAGPLRRAAPWPSRGTAPDDAAPSSRHAAALARLARAAAERRGEPAPPALWSPPLPARVADPVAQADDALVLGVTDPPGARERGLLTWAGRGALVVAGRGRSGRTTAALRAATAALAAGREVHAVGLPAGSLAPHACLGTVVGPDDPRRLARLLTLLLDRPPTAPPALLVVDDVAAAGEALARLPRGAGDGLLERVVRAADRCALGVVLTGHPRDVQHLLPLAAARLALPVADPVDDAALGVPRDLGGRSVPGRGVCQGTRCQVALPLAPPVAAPAAAPLRLAPLPDRVPLVGLTDGAPGVLTLGVGGDDASPVAVDPRPGVLVVGPAGTGRSTALAVLARHAPAEVLVVAADGPLAAHPRVVRSGRGAFAALRDRPPAAVVVDDLDVLARASPELDDLLADWVLAAEAGDASAPAVLASCRTDRAAAAYRGAVAALRACAAVVVLAPAEPGSADVAGADLAAVTDPARPRHPGRGVVVVRGAVTPVQVALP